MNRSREEAEKIIEQIRIEEYDIWWNENANKRNTSMMGANIATRILDALYPKPESERLKQLKKLKEDHVYMPSYGWLSQDQKQLANELIDAEIAREKAKS